MKRLVLALLAVAALLMAGCSSSHPSAKPSQLNDNTGAGPYLGTGAGPAAAAAVVHAHRHRREASFSFATRTAGHPTLLYFGYTHCPDVCPRRSPTCTRRVATLPASLQKQVYVVFVTTDVKHDTAAVIEQWLSNFDTGVGATFVGLRGTQAQIDAAQAAARIPLAEDGGQTHSAQVLLYGSDDYARVTFLQSNNEVQAMAHDLPLVART